ncbi:hypothetical protein LES17_26285, partial [Pseudomonas aeruginosa]
WRPPLILNPSNHSKDDANVFTRSGPFVTSNIIGATSLEQLETNLGSVDLRLDEEVLAGIDAIHREQPNPAP